MPKIIGYFQNKPTWREIDEKTYRKIFNHELAIAYLRNEIYESIEREIEGVASHTTAGFYAALRFLFAEVAYLSNLYWGVQGVESKFVARYMRKFKILLPTSGLHYEVFRHGLSHTHHPKWIRKGNKVIPWYISTSAKLNDFGILIPEFSEQVKSSIKLFIRELEIENKESKINRLNKFFEGVSNAGRILTRNDLKSYARSDFAKLKVK